MNGRCVLILQFLGCFVDRGAGFILGCSDFESSSNFAAFKLHLKLKNDHNGSKWHLQYLLSAIF